MPVAGREDGSRGLDVRSRGAVVIVHDLGVDRVLERFREQLVGYGTLRGGSMLDTWHRPRWDVGVGGWYRSFRVWQCTL